MKHLGDITQIDGAEIDPVDIITFGSPCTRLSVAGRHDGFDIAFDCQGTKDEPHKIYENKIRAIDKCKYIYEDICPICGKELSETNESALFFHAIRIISEMRDTTNGAYPRYIIWENVPGAFSSNKGQDFRAVLQEIGEVELPMPDSGRWATAGMVRTEECEIAWRTLDAQYWGVPQRRRRIFLVADFGGNRASEILFVEQGLRGDSAESREEGEEVARAVGEGTDGAVGINGRQDPCYYGNNECYNLIIETQLYDMTHADEVMRPVETGLSPTLNSRMGTGGNQVPVMLAFGIDQQGGKGQANYGIDVMPPLCSDSHGTPHAVSIGYAVRRLTPLECLRLQGFPDNWLDIEGMSDTAKYKAIGNSLAIPCSDFVMAGIARVMEAEQ